MIQQIGLIAAVALPLWNIPLIVKIISRRSSKDISLSWAVGVWTCLLLMAPSGFVSPDPIWRIFNVLNFFLFSIVMLCVVIYRRGSGETSSQR